jgi:hypothetical protein
VLPWLARFRRLGIRNEELEKATAQRRSHSGILHLRFRVYSAARHWELALVVAEALFKHDSEIPDAWINRSFVLHKMKRTAEAESLLLPALGRFRRRQRFRNNPAFYACVLGNTDKGRALLDRAFTLSGKEADELKLIALDDPDLAALWVTQ